MDLVAGTTVQVVLPDLPIVQADIPDSTHPIMLVPGPPGPTGPGVTGYTHTQASSSATWPITHNLGRYPSVAVRLATGDRVLPDVADSSLNALTLTFATPQTGTAQLI